MLNVKIEKLILHNNGQKLEMKTSLDEITKYRTKWKEHAKQILDKRMPK